jgi:excisionase family DNA binding protein
MAGANGSRLGTMERLLTVEEVAELLKVPASWVYGHTRKRSADPIPGFRLGEYWRFREADVLAWLERQRVGQRPMLDTAVRLTADVGKGGRAIRRRC